MKVGQQSLPVFVFSMVLARLIGFALDQIGRSVASVTAFNLAGMLCVVAVAYIAGWFRQQPWRQREST
jgi:uncharacterized membrane protein YidH (DUF202 family)